MDAQTARAILSEAAAGNYFKKSMPEDEKDLIDLAQYYYDEAIKWVDNGNPEDENLNAIINLGTQISPPVLSESADNTNEMGTPPGESAFEMPLPEPIPETQLNMPGDLTDIGDKALRRLYSTFNVYCGRARWMLANAQSNLANATHLRDADYRAKYKEQENFERTTGNKLPQATLDIIAKETKEYKNWDEKVLKHEQEVTNWRALTEIYSKNVEVLSREWTMRQDQYERER